MAGRGDEVGYFGRLAIMMIGLGLMRQLQGPRSLLEVLVGVLGLVLFLAAVGAIEFGMAVWYRMKRHRLTSHRPTDLH